MGIGTSPVMTGRTTFVPLSIRLDCGSDGSREERKGCGALISTVLNGSV